MASASAIADGLIANLGAASLLGPTNVGKDYKILESSASAACVVAWTTFQSRPAQFGSYDAQDMWRFQLRLYLRDTGNPYTLLNRTFTVPQAILDSLKSDNTLQDTVVKIDSIDGANQPGDVFEAGGHAWLMIPISVQVTADW